MSEEQTVAVTVFAPKSCSVDQLLSFDRATHMREVVAVLWVPVISFGRAFD
jgi:hypothetical protein